MQILFFLNLLRCQIKVPNTSLRTINLPLSQPRNLFSILLKTNIRVNLQDIRELHI